MSKPRIGVTTGQNPEDPNGGNEFYIPYAKAVELAGGEAVYLPNTPDKIDEVIENVDGLLLTGGKDVHPDYYDSRNEPGDELLSLDELIAAYRMDCDPLRDDFEIPLIKAAFEYQIPIFGICKGFQVMNVALGGSLVKDIRTGRKHWAVRKTETDEGEPGTSRSHLISIVTGSRLDSILGDCPTMVNSRHHQGVIAKFKSDKLIASAVAPDGMIEALEAVGHPWAMAVQWHPERIEDDYIYEPSKKLFAEFVNACNGSL